MSGGGETALRCSAAASEQKKYTKMQVKPVKKKIDLWYAPILVIYRISREYRWFLKPLLFL
jgi:hypothetical protein